MNHPSQTAGESFFRVAGLVIAWITSVSLADVQLWIAIFSGLLICLYTGMKIYLLWRDQMNRVIARNTTPEPFKETN